MWGDIHPRPSHSILPSQVLLCWAFFLGLPLEGVPLPGPLSLPQAKLRSPMPTVSNTVIALTSVNDAFKSQEWPGTLPSQFGVPQELIVPSTSNPVDFKEIKSVNPKGNKS